MCTDDATSSLQASFARFEGLILCHSVDRPPWTAGILSPKDVGAITDYVTTRQESGDVMRTEVHQKEACCSVTTLGSNKKWHIESVIVEGGTMVSMENRKGMVMEFFLSNVCRYFMCKAGRGSTLRAKESFMIVLQVITLPKPTRHRQQYHVFMSRGIRALD